MAALSTAALCTEESVNRGSPPDLGQPEILEAILESHLQSHAAAHTTELEVCAEPSGLHLRLTDATCPDPLLMMNYLGSMLATLPIGKSQRVSFSGGSHAQGSPTWIGFIDVAEFAPAGCVATELVAATSAPEVIALAASEALPELRSRQDYERFITDHSSWFTPAVKANSRLHNFAKVTQRERIAETAELLAHTLTPDETLLDVLPVRYRRCSSSLVLTSQRLWCVCESLRLQRPSSQDLFIFLNELEQIEIAENGLRFRLEHQPEHQADHRIYFNVSESQNLEIVLSYFTRVVRRPVIAETTPKKIHPAAGLGLVASLVLGIGWSVAGFTNFVIRHVPLEQQAVEARDLEIESLNAGGLNAGSLNAGSLNAGSLNTQTPTGAIAPPGLVDANLAASGPAANSDANPQPSHCLDRFNTVLHPNGYAVLNRVTQTLMIHLETFADSHTNGFEFDALAEQIAQEAFARCDHTSVNQVRVEDGRYLFFRNRS